LSNLGTGWWSLTWGSHMLTDLGMCEHAGRHVEQSGDRLIIIDMGSHMLTGQVGSQNLLQVAVPGLEDRARTFAPLHGVLLMPGRPAFVCSFRGVLHERMDEKKRKHKSKPTNEGMEG